MNFIEFTKFVSILGHNIEFFNYMDPGTHTRYIENNYYHQSCVIIKNAKKSQIAFVGNTFDSNVGFFGGAIYIDNKDDWA